MLTCFTSDATVYSEICYSEHVCESAHLYYEFTESLSPVRTVQCSNCGHRMSSANRIQWLSGPP